MPNDFDTSQYPLGSTHPYVLYNNAGNEDLVVNDVVNETWVDRPPFNRVRKTLYGMEQEFLRALAKMGYETAYLTYVDGVPLQVDRPTQLITRGDFVYAVKLPNDFPVMLTGTWATDAPLLVDVGDQPLRSELASDSGSLLLGYKAPFTGSGAITQAAKNAQTVHIDDFSPTPANTWLSRAIDGTPPGWTLQLGAATYIGMITKNRNNIRIVGMGMPNYNSAKTALEGGTIIQGYLHLNGDCVCVENLGIDSGVLACNALNSGTAMQGLMLLDPARVERVNNVVRDVTVLCATPGSPVHCFLLEGHVGLRADNLHSRYGQWGVALKARSSHVTGILSHACAEAGFTFKSDSGTGGTRAEDTTVDGVEVRSDDYASALRGIFIYASTRTLYGLSLTNFIVDGCVEGVVFQCDSRASPVNMLFDCVVSNGVLRNQTAFNLSTVGAVQNVVVSNVTMRAPGTNTCVKLTSDCLGITLQNLDCRPTAFAAANLDLHGRFSLFNVNCLVNGDYGSRGGINMTPDAKTSLNIGAIKGRTFFLGNEAVVTLQNGWTAGEPVNVLVNNGRVTLTGRLVVPSTPWTGKEQCGQITADAIRPSTTQYFAVYAQGPASMVAAQLRIEVTGAMIITQLNTSTAFPTGTTSVFLANLSYPIPL